MLDVSVGLLFILLPPLIVVFVIWGFFYKRKLIKHSHYIISDVLDIKELLSESHVSLYDQIWESNRQLHEELEEIRLQLGILNGSLSRTVHGSSGHVVQERLPYSGAKRGPKPKKDLESNEQNL